MKKRSGKIHAVVHKGVFGRCRGKGGGPTPENRIIRRGQLCKSKKGRNFSGTTKCVREKETQCIRAVKKRPENGIRTKNRKAQPKRPRPRFIPQKSLRCVDVCRGSLIAKRSLPKRT